MRFGNDRASLVERLEGRSMFSYTFGQSGGLVTATGTSSSDTLDISQSGGTVSFSVNGGAPFNFTLVTGITVNANAGNDSVSAATSLSTGIALAINGGSGNDTLVGGNGNDIINGDDGIDDVEGKGGNDSLYGGLLNDVVLGGTGNDNLFGGDGDDNLRGDAGADIIRGEGGSNDRVDEGSTAAVKVSLDNVANDGTFSGGSSTENDNITQTNEIINTTDFNDYVDASFVSYAVTIYTYGGNDLIAGGSGSDYIDAGAGSADTVSGGGGVDTILNAEF